MHYGDIKRCDVANGPGVRVSLFVSGCNQHCVGCFNSETWDFNYGKEFTQKEVEYIFNELSQSYITGLTLLGGDPLDNECDVLELCKQVRDKYPNTNIWIYSGQVYEDIILNETKKAILDLCDVLVDGRFDCNLCHKGLRFRGSKNQRIIDLKRTRTTNQLTLWNDGEYGDVEYSTKSI